VQSCFYLCRVVVQSQFLAVLEFLQTLRSALSQESCLLSSWQILQNSKCSQSLGARVLSEANGSVSAVAAARCHTATKSSVHQGKKCIFILYQLPSSHSDTNAGIQSGDVQMSITGSAHSSFWSWMKRQPKNGYSQGVSTRPGRETFNRPYRLLVLRL
jgi:hypothetical protein